MNRRTLAVARMHLTDPLTLIVMPAVILAGAFALNLTIWSLVPVDGRQTGGAASLYAFVGAAAVYAVARGLPFALGMGSSRRSFTLGTALTGVVLGLGFGTLLLVLQVGERVSDGWWLHGHFFWFPWFAGVAWPVLWLLLVVSLVAIFGVGTMLGALWARFNIRTVIVGAPLLVVVGGALAVLLTWQHWWDDVFGWFGDLTPVTALLWTAVLAAGCTLGTWATLRRYRA